MGLDGVFGGGTIRGGAVRCGAGGHGAANPSRGAAGDTTTELVELCETESLGVEDRHQRCVGNIDPHLDDTRGHQDVNPPGAKLLHHRLFLLGRHPAMHQTQPEGLERSVGKVLVGARHALQSPLRFLDGGDNDVSLSAFFEFPPEEVPPRVELVVADTVGGNRLPARWHAIEDRDIEFAVDRMGDRPRDRRGSQEEGMWIGVVLLEDPSLHDTEAMLFVDDDQGEIAEDGAAADQCLRSDHDPGGATGDSLQCLAATGRRLAPHEQFHTHVAFPQPSLLLGEHPLKRGGVLAGEEFGGSHQRRLIAHRSTTRIGGCPGHAGRHRREDRVERDGRLAAADVPLEETVHRLRPGHVGGNLSADPHLGRREFEREPGTDAAIDATVDGNRWRCPSYLLLATVHPQCQLEHEQLLVDKAATCRGDHSVARGDVDFAECHVDRQQLLAAEEVFGQGLWGEIGGVIERRLHRRPDVRLEDAFSEGIDGQPVGGIGPLPGLEPADLRVGKLPLPHRELGLAGDHDPLPDGEPFCHEGHIEPHRADAPRGTGQPDDEHLPAAAGDPGCHIDDVAGDRGVLAGHDVGNLMGAGEVAVVAGEVHQCVRRRHQPEAFEAVRPGRADSRQSLQRRRQTPRTAAGTGLLSRQQSAVPRAGLGRFLPGRLGRRRRQRDGGLHGGSLSGNLPETDRQPSRPRFLASSGW